MGRQASLHFTHDPPRKSGGSDGAIHLSGSRLRIEEPTPSGLTVVIAAAGRVRLLFPEQKEYAEVKPDEAPLAVPPLSLSGMKRIGTAQLDGRDCDIWERIVPGPPGRIRQRLWVPRGARQFMFLRYVIRTPRGGTAADVTDLREAPQPPALFHIPTTYTKK